MAGELEPVLRIGLQNRVKLGAFWDRMELPGSYWRLYWMASEGASVTERDGAEHPLLPDRLYLLPPNCNLTGRCRGTPVQYFLHFEVSGMAGNPAFPLHGIELSAGGRALLDAWRTSIDRGEKDTGQGILRAVALAAHALGQLSEDALQAKPPDRRIEKVCELMRSFPDREWPLAALAREAGLTANYFLRHFQAVTGVPPGRYLRRLRYDHAARMLSEGNLSIEQICRKVGVKDRFHFSREFKRYFGEPPAAYRRRRRPGENGVGR